MDGIGRIATFVSGVVAIAGCSLRRGTGDHSTCARCGYGGGACKATTVAARLVGRFPDRRLVAFATAA